jgi:hypothetical protein
MHCYNCGEKQFQKGNFCTSCGSSLAVENKPEEKSVKIEQKKEPSHFKEKGKKCFEWLKKKIMALVGICSPYVVKHKKKITIGIVVALALFVAFSYCRDYLRAKNIEKGEKQYMELVAQYENDTNGGKTPEETLALYIKALEAKNIEEAAKYFMIDDQQYMLEQIQVLAKDDEIYQDWLNKTKTAKKVKEEGNLARFEYITSIDGVETVVSFILNKSSNGIWKLEN